MSNERPLVGFIKHGKHARFLSSSTNAFQSNGSIAEAVTSQSTDDRGAPSTKRRSNRKGNKSVSSPIEFYSAKSRKSKRSNAGGSSDIYRNDSTKNKIKSKRSRVFPLLGWCVNCNAPRSYPNESRCEDCWVNDQVRFHGNQQAVKLFW